MPAQLDLSGLHQGGTTGYVAVSSIDQSAATETEIFTRIIPSGQLDTIGAVARIRHWGICTHGTGGATLVLRLKLGSSTIATGSVIFGGSGADETALSFFDVVTVSETTVEANMLSISPSSTFSTTGDSGGTNSAAVASCPELSSGALTLSLTAQWSVHQDAGGNGNGYTARLTTLQFSNQ